MLAPSLVIDDFLRFIEWSLAPRLLSPLKNHGSSAQFGDIPECNVPERNRTCVWTR